MKVLVIDIGGSNIKVFATGQPEKRRVRSGKRLTAQRMVEEVRELTHDWDYEAVSIGYPGRVGPDGPSEEPGNLGKGWVGFDYATALGKPVKILNDAALQALGSYEGGRMLFLGLGTGLGSTLISDKVIVPLELGQIPYGREGTLSDYVTRKGRRLLGKKEWQHVVEEVVTVLRNAFLADYVVLGGGEAKKVKPLPPGTRLGDNENAFAGGFRLWETTVAPLDEAPAAVHHVWKMLR